jgi:hypothetical protein
MRCIAHVDPASAFLAQWVDGDDPHWQTERQRFMQQLPADYDKAHNNIGNHKFREWHELLYSMRSVAHYASWVRRIYVVTCGHAPVWLNASHPRITVVPHRILFDDPDHQLPTFNSLAIESVLHRIPNLSQRFLYFNNDVFLGQPITLDDFMLDATKSASGVITLKQYHDWQLPTTATTTSISRSPPGSTVFQYANFYHDRSVADRVWHRTDVITHWFAHTPHLFDRTILLELESVLAPELRATRRNRFRNVRTDINVHMQQEARFARLVLFGWRIHMHMHSWPT